ncbi:MAG: hypothetical protein J6T20_04570 [Treponema sp.]|nr:hypothetical protein [Treponema sp.]
MEKRKFYLIFFILIGLCAVNLFAQEQSDEASVVEEEIVEETPEEPVAKAEKSDFKKAFNRAMEIIWPWPILSLESGYPEVFSFDIGLETLFIPVADEGCVGTYFCFGYARSLKDNFFRFSAGLAFGMMGLFDVHGGVGIGLMPKNHETLQTWFIEVSYRLIILEIKIIDEKPLKPSSLVDYYNSTYKDGYKFKIGLSI